MKSRVRIEKVYHPISPTIFPFPWSQAESWREETEKEPVCASKWLRKKALADFYGVKSPKLADFKLSAGKPPPATPHH